MSYKGINNIIPLLFLLSIYLVKLSWCLKLLPQEKMLKVQTLKEVNATNFVLDFIGLAKQFGYEAEQHNLTTSDGYILQIFRIPKGKFHSEENGDDSKPVILIEHGLMASADIWAVLKRSLVYVLADAGYDVWLGNVRGNCYGRAHKTLSPDDPKFWNFTFHEYGVIDYADTIDYVLEVTNKTSLTYIGHSMGGTSIVILLSERPEFNKKLTVAITLSPAVYWKKKDPLRYLILNALYRIGQMIDPTGMSEFLPQSVLIGNLLRNFCKTNNIVDICIAGMELIVGSDDEQMDNNEIIDLSHYYPAGTSTKSIYHYCQCAITGGFRRYDYEEKNINYYGQEEPPAYEVKNVIAPLVIIYGENDPLSTLTDNKELMKHVTSNVTLIKVDYAKFTHMDFIIARDVKKLLYAKLLNVISKYN